MKYLKWINKNVSDKSGKTALILGATGSFGAFISKALAYKGCNIIIAARSIDRLNLLKNELMAINDKISIDILVVDLFSIKSVDSLIEDISNITIDYFISTAGVYQLPSSKTLDNLEVHFETNYFSQAYILEYFVSNKKNTKLIFMSSISYRFNKIDYDNIESIGIKNKTKIYARSKRLLLNHLCYYKKRGYNIEIPHPGISPTSLFFGKNKGFKGIIKYITFPLMKLIFQNPSKCALGVLYSIDHNTKYMMQIGPRGLFKIWGYPHIYKLHKCVLNDKEHDKLLEKYNLILDNVKNKEKII